VALERKLDAAPALVAQVPRSQQTALYRWRENLTSSGRLRQLAWHRYNGVRLHQGIGYVDSVAFAVPRLSEAHSCPVPARRPCASSPPCLCAAPASVGAAGFRFPPDVIVLAVGWYLRFGLSYRDVGGSYLCGPGQASADFCVVGLVAGPELGVGVKGARGFGRCPVSGRERGGAVASLAAGRVFGGLPAVARLGPPRFGPRREAGG
jgi:hypothetical protein